MFQYIEPLLFIILITPIVYLVIFSLGSNVKRKNKTVISESKSRYAVIFPAYKEDRVIIDSVTSFLCQDYEKEYFDVFVASDSMSDSTNHNLENLGINVITIDEKISSKANALKKTISSISGDYDYVVILDADNITDNNFLTEANRNVSCNTVLQLHRRSKNNDSCISVLDSVSEEINNSVFRKGHNNLGFSSALIGSGMVIPFNWLRENVGKLNSFAEDKELELLLIGDKINVRYIDDIYVYDEKVSTKKAYSGQRSRWINTQYLLVFETLKNRNISDIISDKALFDKLFQWILPPRLIILGINIFIPLLFLIFDINNYKWLINIALIFILFVTGTPAYLLKRKKLYVSLLKIPVLIFITIGNMISFKLNMKEFGATEHGK